QRAIELVGAGQSETALTPGHIIGRLQFQITVIYGRSVFEELQTSRHLRQEQDDIGPLGRQFPRLRQKRGGVHRPILLQVDSSQRVQTVRVFRPVAEAISSTLVARSAWPAASAARPRL